MMTHRVADIDDRAAYDEVRRTAKNLEHLQSYSGQPYHEIGTYGGIRIAETDYDALKEVTDGRSGGVREEKSYYCEHDGLWIQGVPGEQEFNEIGPLSGSAGFDLVCRHCSKVLGRAPDQIKSLSLPSDENEINSIMLRRMADAFGG